MKRALAWLAGLVGIAALGQWLSRRKHPAPTIVEQPAAADADDPAEELRRKLAARRGPDSDAGPAQEPAGETLEGRRARVHAKAREAIDAMHDDEPAA